MDKVYIDKCWYEILEKKISCGMVYQHVLANF
jgi:hypothetical protein